MLDRNAFATLESDFIESQEFIEIAHDRRRGMNFVCHHNSYLVAGFLQRRGHAGIRSVSGYYRCHESVKSIRHSWLTLTIDGRLPQSSSSIRASFTNAGDTRTTRCQAATSRNSR